MATERVLSNLNLISFKTEGGLQNHIDELQDGDLAFTPDNSLKGTLLDFKWADHLLNDMSWLRADTFSWQSGDVYVAAYNHLVADFEGTTAETETIGDITITFYRAEDKHKICLPDQEDKILTLYNATGVAWYYILDTTNKQFKLPRSKHNKYADTVAVVGNGMTLGLTDGVSNGAITFNGSSNAAIATLGGFGDDVGSSYVAGNQITGSKYIGVTTDPEKSGLIAQQAQDTDQYKYLYFYVGNFERDAVEQTAGVTTEMLNNKADVDLSNMNASQAAKNTIVGWSVPDYSAGVDITWTRETVQITDKAGVVINSEAYYIAPADGMVVIYAAVSNGAEFVFVNRNVVEKPGTNVYVNASFPVSKGDEIRVALVARYYNCQFFPFKGVN